MQQSPWRSEFVGAAQACRVSDQTTTSLLDEASPVLFSQLQRGVPRSWLSDALAPGSRVNISESPSSIVPEILGNGSLLQPAQRTMALEDALALLRDSARRGSAYVRSVPLGPLMRTTER